MHLLLYSRPRQEDNDSRRKVWMGTTDAASWRMQSIVRDSDSESDDEYFDCQGKNKYCIIVLSSFNPVAFLVS